MSASIHQPVMLREVLQYLAPREGARYVDGTFGAGGYSRAILDQAACELIAIDRDPEAEVRAEEVKQAYGERFSFIRGCFGEMRALLEARGILRVDGIVLDVGVSSPQIDVAERGFSFRQDGPLDMRMEKEGVSAADLVNQSTEQELADIFYRYGEERQSRRIAKRIVEKRVEEPFLTTFQLRDMIHSLMPPRFGQIDPATRCFQALRIAVNDELGELERALEEAEILLAPGGRLVVVSFHSLEDRIVKQWVKRQTGKMGRGSRYLPDVGPEEKPAFASLHRGTVDPSEEETSVNPRARSAHLRAVERCHA